MSATRTTLAIAAAGCLGLASGCGSSSPSAQAPPAAGAAPQSSLSAHAQYAGFAAAVNLRPGDVAGLVASAKKEHKSKTGNRAFEGNGAFKRCVKGLVTEAKPVFKASSEQFEAHEGLRLESVKSSVEIERSSTAASNEIAQVTRAIGTPAVRDCVEHEFDALGTQAQTTHVRGGGSMRITVANFHMAPVAIAAPASGTSHPIGLSISLDVAYNVSAHGRNLTVPASIYVDELAFQTGRAEVTLSTMTLGTPFPSQVEARLLALLGTRSVQAARVYPYVRGAAPGTA